MTSILRKMQKKNPPKNNNIKMINKHVNEGLNEMEKLELIKMSYQWN